MKSDPHIYSSELPIVEGQNYVAICGKEVPRAKFVLMFDAVEMALPLRLLTFRCCRRCLERLQDSEEPWPRERYIYGLAPGGEVEAEQAA